MPEHELELAVGETVRIGDFCVTVIDIEGGEVAFRIDPADPALLQGIGARCTAPPAK